ncbi:MAG TPA: bifunctional [glutamate--ammonia ligase]-adenylyl-L-tyrosine phosphorylase/[glutamate--ammonia-ligase] adenylyltransferase [Nevskiaceae bacterium]|nr:bifunctional [glutamate--ammonia ligase]-adenylyl-L-tyrosine phosphorylase/[glutamate--ammonia-ligase] adenylyltransferase [Nevskiaceae bacterium]
MNDLDQVLAASRFARRVVEREPSRVAERRASGWLARAFAQGEVGELISAAARDCVDQPELMRRLRRCRDEVMLRIVWRDVVANAPLDEVLGALSDLADACCAAALSFAEARLRQRFGTPRDDEGNESRPVVLGMGKLGGRELNFSSDIDLIWCYTAPGATAGARSIANEEFFGKLAQDVGRILSEKTEHGFVFRVDTLLRPFGSAGALAWHFDAMEAYYQEHGRDWERYAMIKARPIAGDLAAGQALLDALRPFVYRRYLDFNAIGGLRELKRMIAEEVARKNLHDNVKLGAGGIRELEFIVQAFQLVRGGQEPALRDNRLRPVLRYLGEQRHLPPETAKRLDDCYVHLRRVENAIQMYEDQQTHALPASEEARKALCVALRASDWSRFESTLDEVRDFVQAEFDRVFRAPQTEAESALERDVAAFWAEALDRASVIQSLRANGFVSAPEVIADVIGDLRESRMVRALPESAMRKLSALLPLLLSEAAKDKHPEIAARRVLEVVQAIAGRSTYLTLLRESAGARAQLTRLCAASPWITTMLARSPVLLDQLLDARTLYSPPQRDEMQAELDALFAEIKPEDTEAGMDALRRYRQEAMLRIAACDLAGQLELRKVCDHLTWLAETILERALRSAWEEMKSRHGEPPNAAFAIAGYGKLGGIELGYGSDLDVVFLFDGAADAETNGARPITAGEFYGRLVQRIVNWLATRTTADRAYEVDMELRPSGRSGLMVSSLAGFRQYQLGDAWTWEHQALTRARAVAGHAQLRRRFEEARIEVLTRPRDAEKLRRDIVEMRSKMRAHLDKAPPGRFDLKQGEGGMIDLEFITQYLVLKHASAIPALVEYSDNRRQLEALVRAGIIPPEQETTVVGIYDAYRAWFHARDLQQADDLAEDASFRAERSAIQSLWQKHLLEA